MEQRPNPLQKLTCQGTAARSVKEFSFTVHGCFIYLQVNGRACFLIFPRKPKDLFLWKK
jgi:hypothetical protein